MQVARICKKICIKTFCGALKTTSHEVHPKKKNLKNLIKIPTHLSLLDTGLTIFFIVLGMVPTPKPPAAETVTVPPEDPKVGATSSGAPPLQQSMISIQNNTMST